MCAESDTRAARDEGTPYSADSDRRDPACPDLELLAAFVDGGLEGEPRERVMAHLRQCSACYDIVAETMLLHEEDPHEARERRRSLFLKVTGLAAAAVLAIAVALQWMGGSGEMQAAELLAGIDPIDGEFQLTSGLYSGDDWSRVRGGSHPYLEADHRAFRLGVRALGLEAALFEQAHERARRLLREMSGLAEDLDTPDLVLALSERLDAGLSEGSAREALLRESDQLGRSLRLATEQPYFDLGQWTEAARLAAQAEDSRYFRRRAVRAFLSSVRGATLNEEIAAALEEIEEPMSPPLTAARLAVLERRLDRLVAVGGGQSGSVRQPPEPETPSTAPLPDGRPAIILTSVVRPRA